jgi:hypothetical protein
MPGWTRAWPGTRGTRPHAVCGSHAHVWGRTGRTTPLSLRWWDDAIHTRWHANAHITGPKILTSQTSTSGIIIGMCASRAGLTLRMDTRLSCAPSRRLITKRHSSGRMRSSSLPRGTIRAHGECTRQYSLWAGAPDGGGQKQVVLQINKSV